MEITIQIIATGIILIAVTIGGLAFVGALPSVIKHLPEANKCQGEGKRPIREILKLFREIIELTFEFISFLWFLAILAFNMKALAEEDQEHH